MSWIKKILQERTLSVSLLVLTLSAGLVTGTFFTIGVFAAKGQAVAPDATPLTIPPKQKLSNEFTKIAEMLEPSVVFITTESGAKRIPTSSRRQQPSPEDEDGMTSPFERFFGDPFGNGPQQPRRRAGSGSGFIVDKNGYIITNLHVVDEADSIKVKLMGDKVEYKAKLIGSDPEIDIAIIKIDAGKKLPPVKIANSDGVQVGDWAVAIGAPFGLESTVTVGIISALSRDVGEQLQRFIQTDAAINRGNSGGPLVNINGEVIGVNTMIASSSGGNQGIGFALPVNMAAKAYNQIIQTGRVSRGAIGITFNKMTENPTTMKALGIKSGVIVAEVKSGGSADKAGIKPDDILLALNGTPIRDGDDLVARVSDMPAGTKATVELDRSGQKLTKEITIQDREEAHRDDPRFSHRRPEMTDPSDGAQTTARFGIQLRSLTDEQRKEFAITDNSGVAVTFVEEGSFAEEIGLRERDVIVSINRKPVAGFDDVKELQSKLKTGDAVAFRVLRRMPSGRGQSQVISVYLSGILPSE